MNPIMYNVIINDFQVFHVLWCNKIKLAMIVHHNVKMKRTIYKTDKLKVKVTAFTRYFVKNR